MVFLPPSLPHSMFAMRTPTVHVSVTVKCLAWRWVDDESWAKQGQETKDDKGFFEMKRKAERNGRGTQMATIHYVCSTSNGGHTPALL